MARKPRIHFTGALYHVILRGNAQQDVFFKEADRCRFFLLIQEGLERFDHRVVAFCLMTNHIHLAIQVGNVPLSRIMQNLTFRYTRWINQGHREEFYGKESQDSRVIGEDGFVEQVLEQADALPLRKPGIEVVLGEIRQIYGVTDSELAAPGQKRIHSEARSMAAWTVNELSKATLVELSERLRREPSTMSAAVKRFDERMKTDSGVAEKVERLKAGLQVSFFQAVT